LELNAIEERKEKLKDEKKQLETTTKLFLAMKEELRKKQEEEKIMRQQIRDMQNHPIVRGALETHERMNKMRSVSENVISSIGSGLSNVQSQDNSTVQITVIDRPPIGYESSDDDIPDDSDDDVGMKDVDKNVECGVDEVKTDQKSDPMNEYFK
jgi:hypothetical protein